jgi:hypothetical protein
MVEADAVNTVERRFLNDANAHLESYVGDTPAGGNVGIKNPQLVTMGTVE